MPDQATGPARIAAWLDAGRWRRVAAAILFGLIAALGQAPFGLWPAALLGLAGGYALFLRARDPRRAALTGWALGLGHFALALVWIVQPFLVDPVRHGWMAPFALVLMAGGMALFWGAGAALARWLSPSGRFGWLAFALALGLAELARGTVLTGFPWAGPGLVWIDTPIAQLAALGGVLGLSLATFAAAAALWNAVAGRDLRAAGAVLAIAALSTGFGAWRAAAPQGELAAPVHLRLVQPNAPQHLKWDPDWVATFFERAKALSAQPVAEGAPLPDLVIWPETSVPTLLGRGPTLQAEAVAAAAPARLIAGVRRFDGARLFNALVLFDEGGQAAQIYDKHHVVPFGEYMPLGDLLADFGIRGLAAREGHGYSSGPGAAVLALPDGLGKALPLICYEAIFPGDLRAAPERADWILQITNDAWFGTFSGPQQHLAQARFRAIEFGLPLVRAANTGVSAVIGARGQLRAALPLNEAGALDAALPPPLPPTAYARLGDWPLIALLGLGIAALAARRRSKGVDRRGAGR